MNFLTVPMAFLAFLLFSCNSDDAIAPIAPVVIDFPEILNFQSAFPINMVDDINWHNAIGLVASEETNNLYHAVKTGTFHDYRERVNSFDLSDGGTQEQVVGFDQQDYFGKRMEIVDSKIHVFTPSRVNIYDLELNLIESISHNSYWFNFDLAAEIDAIWAVSADFESATKSFNISWWDKAEGRFVIQKSMEEGRNGAAVEIIDDKLFVIGGTNGEGSGMPTNTILIYNIHTKEFESPVIMPFALRRATATKYKHLILIAGLETDDNFNFKNHFGVYNTLDGTFSEIEINLDVENIENFITPISAMSVLEDKLYIAIGAWSEEHEVQVVNLK